jgi:outer membrane protein assembly factor BamB
MVQAHIDRAVDHMSGLALEGDGLFVLTKTGTLQMIDAETGATRWIVQPGNRLHPASGPAAGERYVAMTQGDQLYVFDRATGELLLQKRLQHVATASPTVGGESIYVPLFNGMIVAYDMQRPRGSPWYYRASGHVNIPPIVTPNCLAWTTNLGRLFASTPNQLKMRFQFRANGPIVAPLGYESPLIFATSRDGFAYAINENTGRLAWRFAAGDAVSHEPVAIRGSVFIVPEVGGMYCLASDTGQQRWYAPRAKQFLSASPARTAPAGNKAPAAPPTLGRVYAADDAGNTMILDANSGARLDTIPTAMVPWKFTNAFNDRIYLGSRSGMIQCLHEIGLQQPTSYRSAAATAAPPPEGTEAGSEAAPAGETSDEPAERDPFDEP